MKMRTLKISTAVLGETFRYKLLQTCLGGPATPFEVKRSASGAVHFK